MDGVVDPHLLQAPVLAGRRGPQHLGANVFADLQSGRAGRQLYRQGQFVRAFPC